MSCCSRQLDEFLPAVDKDVSKAAAREFKKQGLDIRLGTKVSGAEVSDGKVTVTFEGKDGEESETLRQAARRRRP